MYDIGIIGGGTAGMTAAIYGQRAGRKTIIIEGSVFGGQITSSPNVENYPGIASVSGSEFSMNLLDQAVKLGAETAMEQVTGIRDEGSVKVIETAGKEYPCRSVILATGVTHRHLGVPNEERLTGAGVSYCATCDGMFFRGRDVAVVGGGSTALQDAEFLSDYCRKVYLIHRRLYRAIVEDTEYVVRQEVGKTYALHLSARLYLLESLPGIAVYSLPVAVILRVRRPMYKEEVYIIEPEIA